MTPDVLKSEILELVRQFWAVTHKKKQFVPGEDTIPSSGKVYGPEEMVSLVDSSLDFWLTSGRFNSAFERKLGEYLGVSHAISVNSGSSANLLSLAALASPQLNKKSLNPGDEIITVAAAFPTTVNPLLLYGMVPVFVDIDIPTYNIDANRPFLKKPVALCSLIRLAILLISTKFCGSHRSMTCG
jgi:CDP-6-deoxy-D-xylo-4-hexulose-3-dehydrase